MLARKLGLIAGQLALRRPNSNSKPYLTFGLYRKMSNHAAAEITSHRTLWTPNQYPTTRRTEHVDIYKSKSRGEVKVPDPYNWLEENTTETDNWTTVQQEVTRKYLDQNPQRNALEEIIRANSDYAKASLVHMND